MRHTLTLDYRPLPDGAGHLVRALLELQGVPAIAATRAPLRLSIVLDRSGSMAGAPLAAATQADEIMITSPIYDHEARKRSYELMANAYALAEARSAAG